MQIRRLIRAFAQRLAIMVAFASPAGSVFAASPYPYSDLITGMTWHDSTYESYARGSDLWAPAWHADGNLYTGWGDGTGFSASEKKSWGVSRLTGMPPGISGVDLKYGPAGSGEGKIIDMICIGGTLYAQVNLQDATPRRYQLWWSTDNGASWSQAAWKWPNSTGTLMPRRYMHAGQNYTDNTDGYVYIYGARVGGPWRNTYLARVPKTEIKTQSSYRFFAGLDGSGNPTWTSSQGAMQPVFTDSNTPESDDLGVYSVSMYYNKPLARYLFVKAHGHAGRLGVFETTHPWGPWKTVYYSDSWLGFDGGDFLACGFPGKYTSSDGTTMWAVISLHEGGDGGSLGNYHDRLVLMKTSLSLTADRTPPVAPRGLSLRAW